MNSIRSKWGIVALVIAVLLSAVAVVGAQQANTDTTTTQATAPQGHVQILTVVAEQLGISADELVTALQGGKTVADLATEKDVALSTIVDAVVASHSEQLTAAVTAGTLTQAQADAHVALLKANLEAWFSKAWTPGNGRGMGMDMMEQGGMGGMMGRGGMGDMGGMMGHGGMGDMGGMMGRGGMGDMGGMMGRGGHGGHGGMGGMNGQGGMGDMNGQDCMNSNCPAVTPEATVVPNS